MFVADQCCLLVRGAPTLLRVNVFLGYHSNLERGLNHLNLRGHKLQAPSQLLVCLNPKVHERERVRVREKRLREKIPLVTSQENPKGLDQGKIMGCN